MTIVIYYNINNCIKINYIYVYIYKYIVYDDHYEDFKLYFCNPVKDLYHKIRLILFTHIL